MTKIYTKLIKCPLNFLKKGSLITGNKIKSVFLIPGQDFSQVHRSLLLGMKILFLKEKKRKYCSLSLWRWELGKSKRKLFSKN